jgi:hypothetical protein
MTTEPTVSPAEHEANLSSAASIASSISNELSTARTKSAAEKFEIARKTDKDGKPVRAFVSTGEKIHNEITYRGVDWLLNSAFGVAFAYWTHRTESGRKYFSQPVEKFFTKILSPIFKDEKALKGGAEWGGTFLSIMFGGTVTIPPLMHLENPKNKVPLIKRLDTWIYGKDKVENDPKFAQAYEEIKHQPKKDFWTGLYTRFIALAPLLAITVYKPTQDFMLKNFYNHIASGTKYVGEKVGLGQAEYWSKKSVEGIEKMSPEKANEVTNNWHYVHSVIAFDFGLTIFYSFLHEVAYKLFAKKKDDALNRKEAEKRAAVEKRSEPKKEAVELEEKPLHRDETARDAVEEHAQAHEKPHHHVSHVAEREVLHPHHQSEAQLA